MEKDNISLIRFRGSKLSQVKELDLFPKVEETYKETSTIGGTLTFFGFIVIVMLIYKEINYYMNSKFIFKFSPDTDFDAKLKLNVDITVAMPCSNLGADILDSTNQNTLSFGQLEEEDTWFELSQNQRYYFDNKKHINSYLREEYHAIKDLLWKSSFSSLFGELPARMDKPDRPYDACRIYGSLILNKVAGNFHITAGKSLNFPRGHIHISAFMSESDYNFTHRINRFSFGDPSPGIVHPLEGDEYFADNGNMLYQYFIEVVPTIVKTFIKTIDTYQYSSKELFRPIDHHKGSHGMPGIFFKYDVSALKVTISQQRDHLLTFIAKLCSFVGGVFICIGFVNSIVQFAWSVVCSKRRKSIIQTEIKKESNLVLDKRNVPDVVPVQLM